jgi:AcrR family transcriptional regulator
MTSMAERKRRLVADEITEAALQLMAVKGFEATTIDEVAIASGVSRRTFFRYFASKEDVAVQLLADLGEAMCAELAARPPAEPPSVALRHAVEVALDDCHGEDGGGNNVKALRVVQLILGTPALLARFLEREWQWRIDLADRLAQRLGLGSGADIYPRMAASTALAAFETVVQRWAETDGAADIDRLTAEVFAVVGPSLDLVPQGP